MKVQIRFFAVARQLVGSDGVEVELSAGATIADVRSRLVEQFPQLGPHERHLVFSVNATYAHDDTPVPEGAEVACIPPVSGG